MFCYFELSSGVREFARRHRGEGGTALPSPLRYAGAPAGVAVFSELHKSNVSCTSTLAVCVCDRDFYWIWNFFFAFRLLGDNGAFCAAECNEFFPFQSLVFIIQVGV